ncbi:hypothetical protein [Enterovibrio sp. 27052020O]|uniref:hypothetical protein n=1 Tax=Enterovibrio sp. 27052020O TaxID=3241166 RepID=UPI00388EC08A
MKLNILCRLEPGCLGPQGASKIDDFCQYIKQDMLALNSDSVTLNVVPRNDKSLPEIQFTVMGKMMTRKQAEQYLERLDQNLDNFEALFEDKLEKLIDKFMGY